MSDENAIIGRCEVLFCINPAELVEYRDNYDRELAVCGECADGEFEKGSKRSQLAHFTERVP